MRLEQAFTNVKLRSDDKGIKLMPLKEYNLIL